MPAVLTQQSRSVVHQIRPLEDERWDRFISGNPDSSIFHTRQWLHALHRTYGYEPIVFTTSPRDAELTNALVFCRVDSWLTGSRLVSLPFSDHCAPLAGDPQELQVLFSAVEDEVVGNGLDYMEFRPRRTMEKPTCLVLSNYSYCLHQVDLRPPLEILFRSFHRDSVQRKIRRAEREGLTYEQGRSDSILDEFYRLQLLTRRRHGLPPQPKAWFQNLADHVGSALQIRVARKSGRAVAAILTLSHKDVLTYKYGCSDARFNNLGGTQLLFWRSIQEAKGNGLRLFDLGRSKSDDVGLTTFKDRWGSTRSTLPYTRYCASERAKFAPDNSWEERIAKRAVSHLPTWMFQTVGELLYRHVG